MPDPQPLLWYASYGSNILYERFRCYVEGGQITGNSRVYEGCRNTQPPRDARNIRIPHQLYFAKQSQSWNGGGVCFVRHQRDRTAETLGRMYLITREQFEDVVRQESNTLENFTIDYSDLNEKGFSDLIPNVWYGRMIYLGEEEGHPIYSFTNSQDQQEVQAPSLAYLSTIMRGLQENFQLNAAQLAEYFIQQAGIEPHFDRDSLRQLARQL